MKNKNLQNGSKSSNHGKDHYVAVVKEFVMLVILLRSIYVENQ